MKNLQLVSFVGVDLNTDLESLLWFNQLYSIKYEFGVLYSDSKNNTHIRYPGYEFCEYFLKWTRQNNICNSLHICGTSIIKYLKEDPILLSICKLANRIQLNLNIDKFNDYDELSNAILEIAERNNHHIILQKNSKKCKFNENLLSKINKFNVELSWLYDSSGGFGRQINKVVVPDMKYFTGYAGGINPDNIIDIINLINDVNTDNRNFYVDMESGVRANNYFSIYKCKLIKELIEKE